MTAALLALHLVLAATDPYETGLDRYRDADYYGAADAFQRALKLPRPPERAARAWVWLGLAMFNLNDTEAARADFKSALRLDPGVTLPDDAPPKAAPLFEEVRQEARAIAAKAGPKPSTQVAAAPEAAPAAAPKATATASPGGGPALKPWMAYVAGGVAGGLAVTAGGLKLSSNSSFDAAAASPRAAEAAQLSGRADAQQHAALYLGLAAATTLAAAGVLYFLSNR